MVKLDQPLLDLGGVVIDRADATKADFLHQRDLLGRRLVRRVLRAGIHREKRFGSSTTPASMQPKASARMTPANARFRGNTTFEFSIYRRLDHNQPFNFENLDWF